MLKFKEAFQESFKIAKEIRDLHCKYYKKYWKECVVLGVIAAISSYVIGKKMGQHVVEQFDFEAVSKPWGESLEDDKEEES